MSDFSLSQLPPGGVARVTDVLVSSEDAARLKALGICFGRKVQLVRVGDPLIVRVLGGRVGISARLAAEVQVQAMEAPRPATRECSPAPSDATPPAATA